MPNQKNLIHAIDLSLFPSPHSFLFSELGFQPLSPSPLLLLSRSLHCSPPEINLSHPILIVWGSNTSVGKTLVSVDLAASVLSPSSPNPATFLYLKPVPVTPTPISSIGRSRNSSAIVWVASPPNFSSRTMPSRLRSRPPTRCSTPGPSDLMRKERKRPRVCAATRRCGWDWGEYNGRFEACVQDVVWMEGGHLSPSCSGERRDGSGGLITKGSTGKAFEFFYGRRR